MATVTNKQQIVSDDIDINDWLLLIVAPTSNKQRTVIETRRNRIIDVLPNMCVFVFFGFQKGCKDAKTTYHRDRLPSFNDLKQGRTHRTIIDHTQQCFLLLVCCLFCCQLHCCSFVIHVFFNNNAAVINIAKKHGRKHLSTAKRCIHGSASALLNSRKDRQTNLISLVSTLAVPENNNIW